MNFEFEEDKDSIFETFSDTIFCVCVVLLALVAILALNVNEKLMQMEPSVVSSGGYQRPHLYVNAYRSSDKSFSPAQIDHGGMAQMKSPWMKVALFSPSSAKAKVLADPKQLMKIESGQSQASISTFSLSSFMYMAVGIEPGEVVIEESKVPFLQLNRVDKDLFLPPLQRLSAMSDQPFAKLINVVWSNYEKPMYPVRSYKDYRPGITKIYVESYTDEEGKNYLLIGHYLFPVEDVEGGFLDFFIGMSSKQTQIIYLGEYWFDEEKKSSRRIKYFLNKGQDDVAQDLIRFHWMWGDGLEEYHKRCLKQKAMQRRESRFISQGRILRKELIPQVRHWYVERTLLEWFDQNEGVKEPDVFPPFIKHREAWRSYIESCRKEAELPPPWFLEKFLKPLGFDLKEIRMGQKIDRED